MATEQVGAAGSAGGSAQPKKKERKAATGGEGDASQTGGTAATAMGRAQDTFAKGPGEAQSGASGVGGNIDIKA